MYTLTRRSMTPPPRGVLNFSSKKGHPPLGVSKKSEQTEVNEIKKSDQNGKQKWLKLKNSVVLEK